MLSPGERKRPLLAGLGETSSVFCVLDSPSGPGWIFYGEIYTVHWTKVFCCPGPRRGGDLPCAPWSWTRN
jgi:hypothetical protein